MQGVTPDIWTSRGIGLTTGGKCRKRTSSTYENINFSLSQSLRPNYKNPLVPAIPGVLMAEGEAKRKERDPKDKPTSLQL